MKIIDRNTGRTVATIVTNHSMSLDEAIDLVGVRLQPENIGDPDVSINDEEYSYQELDLIADGNWKEDLAHVVADENKSCKIVSLREMALATGIKHIKRADALEIMRKAQALCPGTKLMQIMKTKNDSLFCSICLVDNDIHFDDEITVDVPEEEPVMKYYTIKPEYAENWTINLDDEMKPVSSEEIERLAREWDVPVSELMEQVEEIDD